MRDLFWKNREGNSLADRIDASGDCWLWTASRNSKGYGKAYWEGTNRRAHRVVWEILVGGVPEGLELDHLCRVRHCVNPDHLEAVTHRENTMRGDTITAANAAKTHCPQGHEYTDGNTLRYRNMRYCRQCNRDAKARYRERRNLLDPKAVPSRTPSRFRGP